MKAKSYLLLIAGLCALGTASILNIDQETTKEVNAVDEFTYVDNSVKEVSIIDGYSTGIKYMVITLEKSDFSSAPNVNSGTNTDFNLDRDDNHGTNPLFNYREVTNFVSGNMKIDGVAISGVNRNTYFRYKNNDNSIGLEILNSGKPGIDIYSSLHEGAVLSIPAGTTFPSYEGMFVDGNKTLYKTETEIEFVYKNGSFVMKTTSVDTEVTSVDFMLGYNGSDYFVRYHLSENDYDEIPSKYNDRNDFNLTSGSYIVNKFGAVSNFATNISYKGTKTNLGNGGDGSVYINYRPLDGFYDSIGLRATSLKNSFQNNDQIVIPAGTSFPSYGIIVGENDIVYETTKDKVFTYYNNGFHCCEDSATATYEKDGTGHWHTCSICSKVLTKENHALVSGDKAPTCLEPGNANSQYCSICGYVAVSGTEIPALGHDFTGAWEKDEEKHWKECPHDDCEEISLEAEHTFNNEPHICDTCGYVRDISIINVVNGYINGTTDNNVLKGKSITVIANSCENGKEFEGWYNANNEKISENSTYTFTPDGDMTLTAQYKTVEFIDYVDIDNKLNEISEEKGCKSSIVSSSIFVSVFTILGAALIKNRKH